MAIPQGFLFQAQGKAILVAGIQSVVTFLPSGLACCCLPEGPSCLPSQHSAPLFAFALVHLKSKARLDALCTPSPSCPHQARRCRCQGQEEHTPSPGQRAPGSSRAIAAGMCTLCQGGLLLLGPPGNMAGPLQHCSAPSQTQSHSMLPVGAGPLVGCLDSTQTCVK